MDGIEAIRRDLGPIVRLIVRTARWVNPKTFRALPVWYPETARGLPVYDAQYSGIYRNKNRATGRVTEKVEANIRASKAFVAALGAKREPNWTVCHVWGVDDPRFESSNGVVRDPRFYSCPANMVWLPTPLKGFTDSVPEVKAILRRCAYHLYGWACDHEAIKKATSQALASDLPQFYPSEWPRPGKEIDPPGLAGFTPQVASAIERRKAQIRTFLANKDFRSPAAVETRDRVQTVLKYWQKVMPFDF
jgi:hypothetical protein